MTQQIGLEAVMRTADFDAGVARYLAGLTGMDSATKSTVGQIGQSFAALGGTVLTAATVAMAAFTAATIKAGQALADFLKTGIQDSMALGTEVAGIAAIMGGTVDDIKPLKDLIDDLALDKQLKVDAEGAAEAISKLAKNGLTLDEILAGAARSTVLLANATGSSFDDAASVASITMKAFNLDASDMGDAVDTITGVVNSSRMDINSWRLAVAMGGGTAAAVGIELEDFAAALIATEQGFAGGSDQGTSYKRFLQTLVPRSTKAAEAMEELGLITENGSNQFFDAAGNVKSLNEISKIMTATFGNLSAAEQLAAYNRIFGTDASRAAVQLTNLSVEAYDEAYRAVTDFGLGERSAAIRTSDLGSKVEILSEILDTIRRKSGEQFTDMLLKWTLKLTDMAEAAGPKVIEFFGKFAEAVDKMGERLMPLIEQYFPIFLEDLLALGDYFIQVAQGGGLLNSALEGMSEPLQKIIERVVGAWEGFKNFISVIRELWQGFKDLISPLTDFLSKFVTFEDVMLAAALSVAAFLAPLALIIAKMAAVGVAAAAAIAMFKQAWETDFGGVKTFIQETWEQIKVIFELGQQAIQAIWEAGGGQMLIIAQTIWENVKVAIKATLDVIIELLSAFIDVMNGDWQAALDHILEAAKIVWEAMKEVFQNNLDALASILGTVIDELKDLWDTYWEWMTTTNGETWDNLVQGTKDKVKEMADAVLEAFESLSTAAAETLNEMAETIGNTIKELVKNVVQWFKDMGTQLVDAVKGISQAVVDSFNEMIDRSVDAVKAGVQRMVDAGKNLVGGFIDGIQSRIGDAQAKIAELTGLTTATAETELAIESPSKVFFRIGNLVGEGFINGLSNMMINVRRETAGMFQEIARVSLGNVTGQSPQYQSAYNMPMSSGIGSGGSNYTYNTSNNIGPFQVDSNIDLSVLRYHVKQWIQEELR